MIEGHPHIKPEGFWLDSPSLAEEQDEEKIRNKWPKGGITKPGSGNQRQL